MKVEVLVCRPDGSQTLELKELPDNWYSGALEQEETGK